MFIKEVIDEVDFFTKKQYEYLKRRNRLNDLGDPFEQTTNTLSYQDIPKMARMPTLKERLELAVKQAEEKLNSVKRAKEILEKNPDLEELLNIMQKNHF